MSLEMTESKQEQMGALEDKSIEMLMGVLNGNPVDDAAKMAMKTLGVVAKNRQTLTAREGIRFAMARMVASPDQLKKYVESTQPEIKKLTSGKQIT